MAPPNPKRPPRPPRPPGTQAPKDSDVELPFDDDEVDPLRADDPRPQRVPQFPAGSRRSRRQGGERGSNDHELVPPRFDWSHEYSDPGHPPAFLYVERGPGVGQLVPVKQGPLVMGRSSSSDLRLQHPSISRRHAQLTRRGDRFFVKDLSSQNGTFLNRTRLTGEEEVMPGDELSMGNALLRLRGPGGTPALGVPVITATNTVPDGHNKKDLSTLRVALIAAALGSGVAALITVIVVMMGGEDAIGSIPASTAGRTDPSTPVSQLASMEVRPKEPSSAPAPGPSVEASAAVAAPVTSATSISPAGAGLSGAVVPTTSISPAGSAASSSAAPTPSVSPAGPSAPAATAPPPSPSPVAAPTGTETAAMASPSAMDVAQGLAVAPTPRQEPGTAEAPSAHGAKVRPVSPEEADVLKRYEAGEVSAARSRARAAKLDELSTQLARFEYAEAASRKAQAKRDLPRALTQLTIAVALDEALSHGLSKHGPQLRKRLAELHVQEGSAHAKGGRVDAARTAFEEALKYDADNREAREGLRQLRPAAAP